MGLLVRWCVVLAGVFAGMAHGAVRPESQSISAPALTAAFLFNFVKFTTWPSDVLQDDDPIVVCVIGSDVMAASLVQLTREQKVNDHPLTVERRNLDRPLDGCHVVYAADLDRRNEQWLIRATAGSAILTVSDVTDFAQRGGIANFFIDGGRMRFAVNPAAAERARLRISSKLLTLAKVVRDDGGP